MLIACCVVAVTLDDGGEQQPSQEPQMEPDLLVAGALVDPVKNGRQFLFRLLEKRLNLLHPGALLQERRHSLLVGAVVPLETAGKAEAVVFVHAVKQSVVGAGGEGQQLCRHIPIGVKGTGGVEMLQKEPGRGVGVDHGAPLRRLTGHDFFKIYFVSSCMLSAVVKQAGEISCFGKPDAGQPF